MLNVSTLNLWWNWWKIDVKSSCECARVAIYDWIYDELMIKLIKNWWFVDDGIVVLQKNLNCF